jgi:hypothetical protein
MSSVVVEVTLRLPGASARSVDVAQEAADRLADEIELGVMGIGDLVGYDLDFQAGVLRLIVHGEDASRLVPLVLPLARTLQPAEGSYYTVRALFPDDQSPPPERIPF